MGNEDLKKDQEKFLLSYYDNEVIEESRKPHEYAGTIKARLYVDLLMNKIDKSLWERITKIFDDTTRDNTRYAFIDGAKFAIEKGLKSVYRQDSPDFMKDRKLWIMVDFGDNDFGSRMEDAGMFYADIYNRQANYIRVYPERERNELAGTLDGLEEEVTILNILKNGYVHGLIEFETSEFPDKTLEDIENQAEHTLEYLKIEDNIRIFKTEDEILQHITSRYATMQDDCWSGGMNDLWCNGECLVMWLDNGTMKTRVI